MNKTQFVEKMHEKSGLSTMKDTEKAYKAFIETVIEALKEGEKIQLVGFGTFDVGERAAREASPFRLLLPNLPDLKPAKPSRMR